MIETIIDRCLFSRDVVCYTSSGGHEVFHHRQIDTLLQQVKQRM